jgi:hypothetical protein
MRHPIGILGGGGAKLMRQEAAKREFRRCRSILPPKIPDKVRLIEVSGSCRDRRPVQARVRTMETHCLLRAVKTLEHLWGNSYELLKQSFHLPNA